MTPKEKAKQLVEKYIILIKYDSVYSYDWKDPSGSEESKAIHQLAIKDAKMYAMVTADEVIEQEQHCIRETQKGNSRFWKEVKKEIIKS